MKVYDDFLPNAQEVRQQAINADYIDWTGYDGQIYKRICITEVPGLKDSIEEQMGPCHFLGQGYRLNYKGELPNQSIHTDLGWGTHALVLYLSKQEDCQGGTTTWCHKETNTYGVRGNDYQTLDKLKNHWKDLDKWEKCATIPMKFNRALIYPSHLYHSRWPFEAFGDNPENGRLIAVAFFTPMEHK